MLTSLSMTYYLMIWPPIQSPSRSPARKMKGADMHKKAGPRRKRKRSVSWASAAGSWAKEKEQAKPREEKSTSKKAAQRG